MSNIIEQLSEIEAAATSIIQHTDVAKQAYAQEVQDKRLLFDKELSEKTASTLTQIKEEYQQTLNIELEQLKQQHDQILQSFQQEYDENHTQYVHQLLEQIIKV